MHTQRRNLTCAHTHTHTHTVIFASESYFYPSTRPDGSTQFRNATTAETPHKYRHRRPPNKWVQWAWPYMRYYNVPVWNCWTGREEIFLFGRTCVKHTELHSILVGCRLLENLKNSLRAETSAAVSSGPIADIPLTVPPRYLGDSRVIVLKTVQGKQNFDRLTQRDSDTRGDTNFIAFSFETARDERRNLRHVHVLWTFWIQLRSLERKAGAETQTNTESTR